MERDYDRELAAATVREFEGHCFDRGRHLQTAPLLVLLTYEPIADDMRFMRHVAPTMIDWAVLDDESWSPTHRLLLTTAAAFQEGGPAAVDVGALRLLDPRSYTTWTSMITAGVTGIIPVPLADGAMATARSLHSEGRWSAEQVEQLRELLAAVHDTAAGTTPCTTPASAYGRIATSAQKAACMMGVDIADSHSEVRHAAMGEVDNLLGTSGGGEAAVAFVDAVNQVHSTMLADHPTLADAYRAISRGAERAARLLEGEPVAYSGRPSDRQMLADALPLMREVTDHLGLCELDDKGNCTSHHWLTAYDAQQRPCPVSRAAAFITQD